MYLLFGLTALPWGIVGDKLGGKPLMLVMFLGAGISGLLAAFFMDSPTGLVMALGGIGLFSGIYHPIGLGLISKGVGRLSLAMGYNAVFGGSRPGSGSARYGGWSPGSTDPKLLMWYWVD